MKVSALIVSALFALFLTLTVSSFLPISFAMGVAPGNCMNEYDGPITAFKLSPYAGVSLNPSNVAGGLTIEVLNTNSYKAMMTITEPATSSKGNSNPGQQWFNTSYPGYGEGLCTGTVGARQKLRVTMGISMSAELNPSAADNYQTTWSTWGGSTVSYNVLWVPSPNNDIFIGVANYALHVAPGQTVTTKIYVVSVEDYSGAVTMFSSGPSGLAISESPSTVTVSAGGVTSAILTVSASSTIAKGMYAIELSDTGAHCVTCTNDISVKVK